jgi:hypothetical protein
VRATWTGSSLFDSSLPLDKSNLPEPLVVPFTTSSDLLRLPALSSVTRPTMSTALNLGMASLREDRLQEDALDSLFELPAVPSATILSDLVQTSDRTTTSLIGPADLFAPMAANSPTIGRMLEVRQPVSGAEHPVQALARSQEVDDDRCRVGPVKEEPSREVTGRFRWASDSRGPHAFRTLDEALHELLAAWEQH